MNVQAIQIAVARADLILCSLGKVVGDILPGLLLAAIIVYAVKRF